ncbi:hypothetical protein SRABI118_02293 [Massilia sp. Bi118]|uniref:hypothetical protein n=1 Tax=Massilia sp. Bi118 TaxID=2822346 RepID=UPI001D49913B|nr:hypothetical protein [Massilia sp. Bi118]CAH0223856.1 hypothetical protein SRABI118_02293 [Massilia sp. Bi118]
MASILIQDLNRKRELDQCSMSAIRGGSKGLAAFGPNVNLNLDQRIGQVQDIKVNVLNNNGVIGPGFVGPDVTLNPLQWATNNAAIPL